MIGLKKDELGGKIMTNIVWLKAKTYVYLIDDRSEDRKETVTKENKEFIKNNKLILQTVKISKWKAQWFYWRLL